MKKFIWFVLPLLIACGSAHAARAITIPDRTDLEVSGPDGKPLGLAETRNAILVGARKRGWQLKGEEPGSVRFYYDYRGGGAGATIEVPYQAGLYSIRYVDSHGLRARESGSRRTIHGTYGRWIRNLVDSVSKAAQGSDEPPRGPEAEAATDDADEKDDAPPAGK
jgi:hypothetical protein